MMREAGLLLMHDACCCQLVRESSCVLACQWARTHCLLNCCLPACLPAGRPACLPAGLPACLPACCRECVAAVLAGVENPHGLEDLSIGALYLFQVLPCCTAPWCAPPWYTIL